MGKYFDAHLVYGIRITEKDVGRLEWWDDDGYVDAYPDVLDDTPLALEQFGSAYWDYDLETQPVFLVLEGSSMSVSSSGDCVAEVASDLLRGDNRGEDGVELEIFRVLGKLGLTDRWMEEAAWMLAASEG